MGISEKPPGIDPREKVALAQREEGGSRARHITYSVVSAYDRRIKLVILRRENSSWIQRAEYQRRRLQLALMMAD